MFILCYIVCYVILLYYNINISNNIAITWKQQSVQYCKAKSSQFVRINQWGLTTNEEIDRID